LAVECNEQRIERLREGVELLSPSRHSLSPKRWKARPLENRHSNNPSASGGLLSSSLKPGWNWRVNPSLLALPGHIARSTTGFYDWVSCMSS